MFRVVTDLAVFDFDEETRRMRAIALNPGVSCEQVQANTGFPLAFAPDLQSPSRRAARSWRCCGIWIRIGATRPERGRSSRRYGETREST